MRDSEKIFWLVSWKILFPYSRFNLERFIVLLLLSQFQAIRNGLVLWKEKCWLFKRRFFFLCFSFLYHLFHTIMYCIFRWNGEASAIIKLFFFGLTKQGPKVWNFGKLIPSCFQVLKVRDLCLLALIRMAHSTLSGDFHYCAVQGPLSFFFDFWVFFFLYQSLLCLLRLIFE